MFVAPRNMRPPRAAPIFPAAFRAPEIKDRCEAGKTSAENAKRTLEEKDVKRDDVRREVENLLRLESQNVPSGWII